MSLEQDLVMHLARLKSAQDAYHATQDELQQWSHLLKAQTELAWMEAHHVSFEHDVTPDLQVHPDYGLRVDGEATLRRRRLQEDQRAAEAAAQPATITVE
jgi:hypothetical protein